LNKNNKYKDQIEYRTLTLHVAHYGVDTWTFKKIKKQLKKFLKIFKKIQNNPKKIMK